MKSILKKVAGVVLAAVLALGMFSCTNGIAYPVMETVTTPNSVLNQVQLTAEQ